MYPTGQPGSIPIHVANTYVITTRAITFKCVSLYNSLSCKLITDYTLASYKQNVKNEIIVSQNTVS